MNSFDDLRRSDQEKAARELAKKKDLARSMGYAQKMHSSMVHKCLGELGEYWFGSTDGWIFSSENYEIKNVNPGEWALHKRRISDPYYEDYYILVRYVEESDSKSYFSAIKMRFGRKYCNDYTEEVAGQTKDTSENELRKLLVSIGEACLKPTVDTWYND